MFTRTRTYLPLLSIARTTSAELRGQPAILLLLLSGIILTALIPLLHFHDFGEPGRICRDGALAYQLVIGLILAVAATSSSIHDEISSGTALATLGKPISRNTFLLGKWLGVLSVAFRFWFAVLASEMVAWRIPQRFIVTDDASGYSSDVAAQYALLALPAISLLVAAILHNRKHLRFCRTAFDLSTILSGLLLAICLLFDREWHFSPSSSNIDMVALSASVLILAALAVYGSIATMLSTRFAATVVVVATFALAAAGLSADAIVSSGPFFRFLPIPDLQSFWMCDAVAAGKSLPLSYLTKSIAYAAACIVVFLGAGMLIFRKKDIG